MRTDRRTKVRARRGPIGRYLPVWFAMFNTGTCAATKPRILLAYLAMQVFVWRSVDRGHPALRRLRQQGWCVARVGQAKLARLLGVQRQAVNGLVSEVCKLGCPSGVTASHSPLLLQTHVGRAQSFQTLHGAP
jgi:hypothetical protein